MSESLRTFLGNNAIGILSIFITPLLAWVFNRRKIGADVKKTDADATSILANSSGTLASSWENFAKQMKLEYEECRQTTNELVVKVNTVTSHNSELETRVDKMTTKNTQLEAGMKLLVGENKKLKDYTQKLVGFIESLLDQIEKIDPTQAKDRIQELEAIKIQYKEEVK